MNLLMNQTKVKCKKCENRKFKHKLNMRRWREKQGEKNVRIMEKTRSNNATNTNGK